MQMLNAERQGGLATLNREGIASIDFGPKTRDIQTGLEAEQIALKTKFGPFEVVARYLGYGVDLELRRATDVKLRTVINSENWREDFEAAVRTLFEPNR
jgi:hypothetical protein